MKARMPLAAPAQRRKAEKAARELRERIAAAPETDVATGAARAPNPKAQRANRVEKLQETAIAAEAAAAQRALHVGTGIAPERRGHTRRAAEIIIKINRKGGYDRESINGNDGYGHRWCGDSHT